MTSFTIQLPHKNNDNNGTVKNRIMKAIQNKLPFAKWHGIHTEEDENLSVAFAGPNDSLRITNCAGELLFHALNKKSKNLFNPCLNCPCVKCPFANNTLDLRYDGLSEFDLALRKINAFAEWLEKQEKDPGYDFLYGNTPVRIYQNFIQIGNTILPLNDVYSSLNRFKKEKQENYINIIINISKTEIINNFE